MTQLSPSTEYESKAVALVLEMRNFIMDAQKNISYEEVSSRFRDIQTKFRTIMGKPLTEYIPFVKGEPARSDKVNKFLLSVQSDISILEEQIELMRSSSVYLYNNMSVEIEKARNLNAQAINKVKTLQLYSSSSKNEVTIFGDFFKSDQLFDTEKVEISKRAYLDISGQLTLNKASVSSINPLNNAVVTILSSSNGFPGRLVEVEELSSDTTNSPLTQNPMYRFMAEVDPRSELDYVIDNSPASWFEYEKNLVSSEDRVKANNFGFAYTISKNIASNKDHKIEYSAPYDSNIDWADGPSNNTLRLDLEFDLQSIKTVNNITYTPFDLEENKNSPVLIKSVEVSSNKTTWNTLYPTNVRVGADANLDTASVGGRVAIKNAVWNLEDDQVRYIRFHLEQDKSIDTKIGHIYYRTPKKIVRRQEVDAATPNMYTISEDIVGGERVEGKIPTTDKPDRYYDPSFSISNVEPGVTTSNALVKEVEIFNGKRWAIGVRDITVNQSEYVETSVMISKPFRINGTVDRVSIEAESFIPSSFSKDKLWIKYYVSPDNAANWYQISRIQDDYLGIPEILSFNDPIPSEFREQNIGYYFTSNAVNSLRVKVELSRPSSGKNLTPILYWYRLKVRRL